VRGRKASGQVTDSPATRPASDSALAARIGRTATTSSATRQPDPPPVDGEAGLVGKTFGFLTVVSTDALRKRAVCSCRCSSVREVSVEALLSGACRSCGCSGEFRSGGRPQAGQASFAATAAAAERIVASGRHRGAK